MSSRKSSKLVAVPSYTDWEAHPASGRYYRYYTDETGMSIFALLSALPLIGH